METKTEISYHNGWIKIRSGIAIIIVCIWRSICKAIAKLWRGICKVVSAFWNLVITHKVITALVISVLMNLALLAYGMNCRAREETQDYEYIKLVMKYDSVRHADIIYTSHNNTKF